MSAMPDLIDVLHAVDHLAPDRVLAVEVRRVREADKELAIGAVGVAGARRSDGAALERRVAELGRQVGVLGAAGARSSRIAGLRHEARDHAVEFEAVVEPLLGEQLGPLDVLRREIGPQLNRHLARLQL